VVLFYLFARQHICTRKWHGNGLKTNVYLKTKPIGLLFMNITNILSKSWDWKLLWGKKLCTRLCLYYDIKEFFIYLWPLLTLGVFIAQRLMGLSQQLKQIIQIEHNIVKNPNWPEGNQLAIYKSGRGIELGATLITALITSDIHSGRYPIHGMRAR